MAELTYTEIGNKIKRRFLLPTTSTAISADWLQDIIQEAGRFLMDQIGVFHVERSLVLNPANNGIEDLPKDVNGVFYAYIAGQTPMGHLTLEEFVEEQARNRTAQPRKFGEIIRDSGGTKSAASLIFGPLPDQAYTVHYWTAEQNIPLTGTGFDAPSNWGDFVIFYGCAQWAAGKELDKLEAKFTAMMTQKLKDIRGIEDDRVNRQYLAQRDERLTKNVDGYEF